MAIVKRCLTELLLSRSVDLRKSLLFFGRCLKLCLVKTFYFEGKDLWQGLRLRKPNTVGCPWVSATHQQNTYRSADGYSLWIVGVAEFFQVRTALLRKTGCGDHTPGAWGLGDPIPRMKCLPRSQGSMNATPLQRSASRDRSRSKIQQQSASKSTQTTHLQRFFPFQAVGVRPGQTSFAKSS